MKKYLTFTPFQFLLCSIIFITACFGQEETALLEESVVASNLFPQNSRTQGSLTQELSFEVNRIYPFILITKEKMQKAHTLMEINKLYKPSWVREYISVEILTSHKGKVRKAVSKKETLTQQQKDNMDSADLGTDISVKVQYIPENTLSHKEMKEMDFSFKVDPDSEATYPGGPQQLKKYLKEKAIDKIPATSFKQYEAVTITFAINEAGQVINAKAAWPSNDEKINKLLLETIRNMPSWKPASYYNGVKAKQEFLLIVGDMESCVVNLYKIHED